MNYKTVFRYLIEGSITNGKYIEIRKNDINDITFYLVESQLGELLNDGIQLTKEIINFLFLSPLHLVPVKILNKYTINGYELSLCKMKRNGTFYIRICENI